METDVAEWRIIYFREQDRSRVLDSLVQRFNKKDQSQTSLESIQKEAEQLYKDVQFDFDRCDCDLKKKREEKKSVDDHLRDLQDKIKEKEDTIQKLTTNIQQLNDDAKRLEKYAEQNDNEADESKLKGWSNVAKVAVGTVLAPVTLGVSVLFVGAYADEAQEAFKNAKSKRELAKELRRYVREKQIEIDQNEREKKGLEQEITQKMKEKRKLEDEILYMETELGYLENTHRHLSCFLLLITVKMQIFKQPPSRSSRAIQSTSTIRVECSFADEVHKELDEIKRELEQARTWVCKIQPANEHTKNMLHEALKYVTFFKVEMQRKYDDVLKQKEFLRDANDTNEFVDYLIHCHKNITCSIMQKMIEELNDQMKTYSASANLYRSLKGFLDEEKRKKAKKKELRKKVCDLQNEARDLEQLAASKDKEKIGKRILGGLGIALYAVGGVLVPVTGGLSLVISVAAGPLAAYNLFSAEGCRIEANRKREAACKLKREISDLQERLKFLKQTIEEERKNIIVAKGSLTKLKEDEDILSSILKPINKCVDVILRILKLLQVRQKNFISQVNATVFGEENMATSGESLKIYYDCKVRKPRWSYDDSTMDDKENTRTLF